MAKSSNVSGTWKNELGSIMKLEVNQSGQISGTYITYAEYLRCARSSNSPGEEADIVGYINTQETEKTTTTTLAFCIAWKIEGSCSAFSGQIFKEEDGTDVIKTTWLLHRPVDCLLGNWKATRVGENTFHRVN
ncbi:avidin-like [Paramisgurnus dabryanus]|uniref:avidin-like n=1 Tax=Paramisgurnus dabryanus TaxID=90735 RepID=UPI0031F3CD06